MVASTSICHLAIGGHSQRYYSGTPAGNPTPRIIETPAGMLNAVGLQNRVDVFMVEHLPGLWKQATVIVNIAGNTVENAAARRLSWINRTARRAGG